MLPTAFLLLALQAAPQGAPAPVAGQTAASDHSLSFVSVTKPFVWDRLLPVDLDIDGLKVKTIFFNVRQPKGKLFKDTDLGTRAQVEVTNTGTTTKIPGFAVAVMDAEGKLLGVATGGSKFGGVKAGETETFDMNFLQVKERIPKGVTFVLSVELR
jgi:hypothetical protein